MMRLNIEPLSKNSFMFLFDLKSGECEDKKERQTIKNDDLSLSVPGAGLEPAQPYYSQRILSPSCLPIPPSGRNHWSEKRDSNPRP